MTTITSDGELTFCLKDKNEVPYVCLLSSSKLRMFTMNLFYEQVSVYFTGYQFVVDIFGIYLNWVPKVWFRFYFLN